MSRVLLVLLVLLVLSTEQGAGIEQGAAWLVLSRVLVTI